MAGLVSEMQKSVRRRSKEYSRKPTIEEEAAEEAIWLRKQREMAGRRSTSVVPHRCARCKNWILSEPCRHCTYLV